MMKLSVHNYIQCLDTLCFYSYTSRYMYLSEKKIGTFHLTFKIIFDKKNIFVTENLIL